MKKKMNRFLCLFFLPMLLFVACDGQDDDLPSTENYTMISFQIPSVSVNTRSEVGLVEGTKVMVYAYEINSGVESTECEQSKEYITQSDGSLLPSDGNNMSLSTGLTYEFYAVSPAHDFISGSDKTFSLINSVSTDLKVSSLQATLSSATEELTFSAFQLEYSAIELTLKRDPSSVKITSIVPTSTGIVFSELTHTPYKYVLGDSGIDASTSDVDGSLNIPVDEIVASEVGNLYVGTGYVLPKKSASFHIQAAIVANAFVSSVFSAEIPDIAFLPGKKYTFTVLFTDPKVYLTLSVSEWDGVTTTNFVGGDSETAGNSVTVGGWSTDEWDSGALGTGVSNNTFLIGSWDVSSWDAGDVGYGTGNTLYIGDWNDSSWETGNVGSGSPNILDTNEWIQNPAWSSGDVGKGNSNTFSNPTAWSTGTQDTGDMGAGAVQQTFGTSTWGTVSNDMGNMGE
jgi:hypothetical protein